ncbi:hypothetical protein ACFX2I_016047 [Malus domestica]
MMSWGLNYVGMDYSRKAVCREDLFEPVKPQTKTEKKAKNHRNKHKRGTMGQGHKAKENVVPNYVTVPSSKNLVNKKCFQQEKGKVEANGWFIKNVEDEGNKLEKSDITEEHDLPSCAENNCYLSDGNQGGNKRKRPLIIRFKLQKPSEPDASLAPSSSGMTDFLPPERSEVVPAPNQPHSSEATVGVAELASKCDQESSYPTTEGIEMTGEKRIGREDSECANVMENWIPPPFQFALHDADDEEWLFGTASQNRRGSKRSKVDSEVSCRTSSTQWPKAQLLHEAGIYALSYTVPF